MRRFPQICISATLALLVVSACAHVESPPGGPEDRIAPRLFATRPDTGAVVPGYDGAVVLMFDERISEQNLEESVMVSPRTSPVAVSHGREEIRVELRGGWEPDLIYQVTVGDNVRDLFGNRIENPITVVFSTGPAIPNTVVRGRVTDRITGRLPDEVRVEAVRSADSLVYAVPPDSAGSFQISRFPEGAYQLRAFQDINRNRALDPFEARDSTFIAVAVGAPVIEELQLIEPDSTAPAVEGVSLRGDYVRVELDDYLDPEQTLAVEQFEIRGTAGTLTVLAVTPGQAVPADSAGARRLVDQPNVADSDDRLPVNFVELELEADALEAGAEYEVTVRQIVNLAGLVGGGTATLEVPDAPRAPVDVPPGGAGP